MAGSVVGVPRQRSERFKLLRLADGWLIASALALLVIGLLSLYSVDEATEMGSFSRQVVRAVVGLVPFFVFLLVDPKVWRRFAKAIYVVNLAGLVAVLQLGRTGGGAQRWLQVGPIDVQPSELSKLFIVLTVAAFLASRQGEIRKLSTFALSFLHVAVPAFLVFKQPHLGATLVIVVAWLAVCLAAGVPGRYLAGAVALSVVGLVGGMFIPGVMQPYQKERVRALIAPNPEDNAFQVHRAEVAFSSGEVLGTGYLNGEVKQGRFIPEQDTDFIFTVVGEEGGFVGCALVLAVFAFFLARAWQVGYDAVDPYQRMVAAGLYAVIAFHAVVNLGSILRLLPVVGLWLPFLSYGGSALWLCMAIVGLLANIRARERQGWFG